MSRLLKNAEARRLFLDGHGLARSPVGKLPRAGSADNQSLYSLIEEIGFVQVDTVNAVCRAHHHILHARNQGYREPMLPPLLEQDRSLFEHWTHDASIIPMKWYPHWHHRFDKQREKLAQKKHWKERLGGLDVLDEVLSHIADEGPVSTAAFADKSERTGAWWGWSRHKTALELLWNTGELAIAGRDGFRKIYDLSERVIPGDVLVQGKSDAEAHVDWACRTALERLVIANPTEIAGFWDAISGAEAREWCAAEVGRSIMPVLVETVDGQERPAFAPVDLEVRLERAGEAPGRVRLISPFDPAIRDRKRLAYLFGFDYRIEIFVPEAKRTYGYYVFPLLEGDRFIGRVDLKADRKAGCLRVQGLWMEPGVKLGKERKARLLAELDRCARFAGVGAVDLDAVGLDAQRL